MWSSNTLTRRALLLGLAGTLGACGFTPAYGPDSAVAELMGAIRVDDITTSDGFHLIRQLEHRLGRPQSPSYGLSIGLETSSEGVAVTADNQTTRVEIFGTATFALRDLTTSAVLLTGKTSNFTGYSTTGPTVSELAAERDARERLMIILADQIATELMARSGELTG